MSQRRPGRTPAGGAGSGGSDTSAVVAGLRAHRDALTRQIAEAERQREAVLARERAMRRPARDAVVSAGRMPVIRDRLVRNLTEGDEASSSVTGRAVAEAALFFVASDMNRLVAGAARTLPVVDLREDVRPAACGLVAFEEGFEVASDEGWDFGVAHVDTMGRAGRVSLRGFDALAWRPCATKDGAAGVEVTLLVGVNRYVEAVHAGQSFGAGTVEGEGPFAGWSSQDLKDHARGTLLGLYGHLMSAHTVVLAETGEPVHDEGGHVSVAARLSAVWLMMGQDLIASRQAAVVDGPVVRAYERAGRDVPEVTLVDLRRRHVTKDDGGPADGTSGSGRAYRHRWVTRGHWRNQAYGPGRTLHRPVWIASHVKGPEGAPLLETEQVFVLRR